MDGRILVLDDSDNFCRELADVLEQQFFVVIVKTSVDAEAICEYWKPDVIVLDITDIQMGIAACRQLRAALDIPIIFAAQDPSLEIQVKVFEAGATDMLAKPVMSKPLIFKISNAIESQRKNQEFLEEKNNLQSMAMGFLSSLGESGVLMNFVRSSIRCKTYEELAEKLTEAARDLGVNCFGEVRGSNSEAVKFRSEGVATPLEDSVISQLSTMGRIFQFKSQLIVNFPQVSMVVFNLPTDNDDQVGKIRDNVAILVETTDALCENVQVRQNASAHAEQLQLALMEANSAAQSLNGKMKQTMLDTRILLQELEDNVNRAHSWLGTTSDQERAISSMMDDSIQRITKTISQTDFDEHMNKVLAAMSVSSDSNDLELF